MNRFFTPKRRKLGLRLLPVFVLLAAFFLLVPSYSLEGLYAKAVREQLLTGIQRRETLSLNLSGAGRLTESQKEALAQSLAGRLHAGLARVPLLEDGSAPKGVLFLDVSDDGEESGLVCFSVGVYVNPLNSRSIQCHGWNILGMWFYRPVSEAVS